MKRTKKVESIAYHEAGHAVAAWKRRIRIKQLSILSDGDSAGRMTHHNYFSGVHPEYDTSPRIQRRLENMALVCFAGPAAQRRFNPRGYRHVHADGDFQQAVTLLTCLVGSDKELEAYLKLINVRARQFVG